MAMRLCTDKAVQTAQQAGQTDQTDQATLINGPNLTDRIGPDQLSLLILVHGSANAVAFSPLSTGAWLVNPSEGRRLGTAPTPHRCQAHCVRRPRLICKSGSEAPTITQQHATPRRVRPLSNAHICWSSQVLDLLTGPEGWRWGRVHFPVYTNHGLGPSWVYLWVELKQTILTC